MLILFWQICISFLLVEFFKSQLLTGLTAVPFYWPKSFAEMKDQKRKHTFVVSEVTYQMYKNEKLKDIFVLIKRNSDLIGILDEFTKRASVISSSIEIDMLLGLVDKKQYSVLDAKQDLRFHVFYVSRSFRYHKHFLTL